MKKANRSSSTVMSFVLFTLAVYVMGWCGVAQARDFYSFEDGRLSVKLDQKLENETAGYVTYTKTLPLGRGGVDLTVTVTVITESNYHMIEFFTPGLESLSSCGGLGCQMPLWPYSSVWNIQKNSQAIYARGNGLEAVIRDLETKFNGAQGGVAFNGSGNAAKGELVIAMQNR